MQLSGSRFPILGGVLAAVMASLCCVGPLVLLMLGVSGAWIAQLTALESVRPLFIGLTVVFLGLAFRRIYRAPQTCEPGRVCADPVVQQRRKKIFWFVTAAVVALLAIPLFAPLFY